MSVYLNICLGLSLGYLLCGHGGEALGVALCGVLGPFCWCTAAACETRAPARRPLNVEA